MSANTPEANAALADHFTALAEKYTAEAKDHKAMAAAFQGNPNRRFGANVAGHCDRLAALAIESAAIVGELAKYHKQLAAGAAPAFPKDGARFESGEGAPAPTSDELHHLAMMARTPADHRALEEYFVTVAKRDTASAEHQTAMAQLYRAGVRKGIGDPAVEFDRLSKASREAAKEATAAATLHRQLANVG